MKIIKMSVITFIIFSVYGIGAMDRDDTIDDESQLVTDQEVKAKQYDYWVKKRAVEKFHKENYKEYNRKDNMIGCNEAMRPLYEELSASRFDYQKTLKQYDHQQRAMNTTEYERVRAAIITKLIALNVNIQEEEILSHKAAVCHVSGAVQAFSVQFRSGFDISVYQSLSGGESLVSSYNPYAHQGFVEWMKNK
ncbi:hypothetical protein KBC04_02050 [Candidatus Babeliales bacterium]|nr:hypothetical protein [Candidatus Babeliales bacterium]MBP9843808.1 hypothetical protein [Candidatus Babeliales bacterium]